MSKKYLVDEKVIAIWIENPIKHVKNATSGMWLSYSDHYNIRRALVMRVSAAESELLKELYR